MQVDLPEYGRNLVGCTLSIRHHLDVEEWLAHFFQQMNYIDRAAGGMTHEQHLHRTGRFVFSTDIRGTIGLGTEAFLRSTLKMNGIVQSSKLYFHGCYVVNADSGDLGDTNA